MEICSTQNVEQFFVCLISVKRRLILEMLILLINFKVKLMRNLVLFTCLSNSKCNPIKNLTFFINYRKNSNDKFPVLFNETEKEKVIQPIDGMLQYIS